MTSSLALLGGLQAVQTDPGDALSWPLITQEDEDAVLDVLRRGAMSGLDVTTAFEQEFAAWQGVEYALGFSSGTAAIHGALFGCGVGVGDEIICPSMTYWASCLPVRTARTSRRCRSRRARLIRSARSSSAAHHSSSAPNGRWAVM